MRIHTIAPLAGPRRVLQDTVIDGYVIPKETTVLISLADIHLDPNLWPDPHEIKPERFIDEKGLSKSNEHIYPFGSGKLQNLYVFLKSLCVFFFDPINIMFYLFIFIALTIAKLFSII